VVTDRLFVVQRLSVYDVIGALRVARTLRHIFSRILDVTRRVSFVLAPRLTA
jgi:hypothetical protein